MMQLLQKQNQKSKQMGSKSDIFGLFLEILSNLQSIAVATPKSKAPKPRNSNTDSTKTVNNLYRRCTSTSKTRDGHLAGILCQAQIPSFCDGVSLAGPSRSYQDFALSCDSDRKRRSRTSCQREELSKSSKSTAGSLVNQLFRKLQTRTKIASLLLIYLILLVETIQAGSHQGLLCLYKSRPM